MADLAAGEHDRLDQAGGQEEDTLPVARPLDRKPGADQGESDAEDAVVEVASPATTGEADRDQDAGGAHRDQAEQLVSG